MIAQFDDKIDALRLRMREAALTDEDAMRIRTIPCIGLTNVATFMANAPEMGAFKQGREFVAWLGLALCRHSTDGKLRMGRAGKMGQSDMRRLLVCGAMAAYPPRRGRGSIRTAGSRACWRGCRGKRPR